MKKNVFIAGLLFALIGNVLADNSDWTTFTNSSDIRGSATLGNAIWSATNGGLLTFDMGTMEFNKYTNIEGLVGISLAAVGTDRQGGIWLAIDDGTLQRLDPETMQFDEVMDYQGLVINDLYTYGDSVFICLNIGISLFDINNWEVKETYKIGNVRHLTVHNKDIWAATDAGVKMANLNFPNLIAPSAWTTYTTAQGLPDNDVLAVYADDRLIAAGTESGMAFMQDSGWSTAGDTEPSWNGFVMWNDQLIGSSSNGVYGYSAGSGWSRVGNKVYYVQCMWTDTLDRLWVGCKDDGYYYIGVGQGTWTHLLPDGPLNNNFSAVKVDPEGRLWCASGTAGISMFNGEKWFHYSTKNGVVRSRDFRDIEVDNQGRIWCASFGGGVYVFTPKGNDEFEITNFFTDRLSTSTADNYVATTDLQLDSQGNMWILNYAADSNKPIAVVDSTLNRWQYFSITDGITSKNLMKIEIDQYGRKWFASDNKGIVVLDDNETPFDKSDDKIAGTLTTSDGLVSNNVTAIAIDYDEVFYIGTPEGLNTYFSGNVSEYLDYRVINSNINTIVVDGVNNKWVGTAGGLSMLHSDGFDTTQYTVETYPLVSNNVTSLSFNEENGDLYIATTNGLSRLSTPFKKPAATLDFVKGYPNPFVLGGQASRFYIDNLGIDSKVTLFTAEGYLVRKLADDEVLGSRAVWDGRNDRGDFVSSGVYIYQIITGDGVTKVGKVAVIHP